MKYTIKDIDMKLMENISKNTALEMNLIALKESSGKIFFIQVRKNQRKGSIYPYYLEKKK